MPQIDFDAVSKTYGDQTVIEDFSVDVADGEFLVFLGPSGCGKSTILRLLAGLTPITEGEIRFDGSRVNDLEPRERNVAFVFQSYALYPHMTVRENIAFPLIMDRFKKAYHIPVVGAIARRAIAKSPDVRDRVESVAQMLELEDYLDRRPRTLSGGQRQRVAVGRALVRDPSVYLLDEPLSNLDAKLRAQMRMEIAALYSQVRKTFVYVTHDQVEAMTMATRIVVMDQGRIRQVGSPDEVYNRPADTFVARFIGAPPMNQIPVAVSDARAEYEVDPTLPVVSAPSLPDGQYLLGIRPEQLPVWTDAGGERLPGTVAWVEHLGAETVVGFHLGDHRDDSGRLTASGEDVYLSKLDGTVRLRVGDQVDFEISPDRVTWFDRETGLAARHAAAAVVAGDS